MEGVDFWDYEGWCIIIKKELDGLLSSIEKFDTHIADTLRSFGFAQTHFDKKVWIRIDGSDKHYEYICTNIDEFMVCSRNPEQVIWKVKGRKLESE